MQHGLNQQPSPGTDYPFVEPDAELAGFVDLFVSLPARLPPRGNVKLDAMYFEFGAPVASPPGAITPVGSLELILSDEVGVLFDSTEGLDSSLIESSVTDPDAFSCSMQQGDIVIRLTLLNSVPTHVVPTAGRLDPRAYEVRPPGITTIRVASASSDAEPISLLAGHNVEIQVTEPTTREGDRRKTQLTISAIPGAGDGPFQTECYDSDELPILKINGVGPDPDGRLQLSGDPCLWLTRPTVAGTDLLSEENVFEYPLASPLQASQALAFHEHCQPCVSCEDIIETYEAMRDLDAAIRRTAARAEKTRDDINDIIERWKHAKACREKTPHRLLVYPEPKCRVYVAAAFCNITDQCLENVTLRATVQTYKDGVPYDWSGMGLIRCLSSRRSSADTKNIEVPYVPEGTWPVFDTKYDWIDVNGLAKLRMRLNLPGCDGGDAIKVTLSVHFQQNPSIPVSAPVPSDILSDLWVAAPPGSPTRYWRQAMAPMGAAITQPQC